MRGGSRGSAERSRISPRLSGCSSVGRIPKPSRNAGRSSGNHRCGCGAVPRNMNSMSGAASSGRVLMKACRPPGTTVAGPRAEQIGAHHADGHAVEAHLAMEGAGLAPPKEHVGAQVVLQVLADRQIDQRRDAELAQMRGRPDARQHEQLRRVERAGAHDHLAARPRANQIAARLDAVRPRPRACPSISTRVACAPVATSRLPPPPRRPQIGARRGGATAVPDRELAAAEALLPRPVVVGIGREAGRRSGFDPGVEQGIKGLGELGAERARCRRARRFRRPPRSRRA